jgi:pterin-4a-carbinolamine dehydratase
LKGFYFDTYDEAIDFIKKVEKLANEFGKYEN